QESALYMLRHLLDGEGEWGRAFTEVDTEKFAAPTVSGIDYPSMGLSVAWNDRSRGVLRIESYVATRSARGDATRFTVSNLPDPSSVQVLRDGSTYGAWRTTSASTIEIDSDVGEHRFEIVTGYRGPSSRSSGEQTSSVRSRAPSRSPSSARAPTSAI